MPFALVFVGLLLVITGFQNTYAAFGKQVQGDFTGSGSFLYWMISIILVGSIGYIKELQGLSRAFMVLIVIALILNVYKKNPNFFSSINSGISSGDNASVNPIGAPLAGSSAASGSGSANSGGGASSLLKDAGTVATIASSLF